MTQIIWQSIPHPWKSWGDWYAYFFRTNDGQLIDQIPEKDVEHTSKILENGDTF